MSEETPTIPAPAPADAAPKLDMKMMVMPLMMLASRKIDMKDETNVVLVQKVFIGILAIVGSIFFYVYTRINNNKDKRDIWVPPKEIPKLPFNLGPAPEPVTADKYTKTTYKEHEMALFKEAAQAAVMSAGIAFFTSYKFQIHFSLLVQCVMTPLNATDSPVIKKYVLGNKSENLYKELYSEPTNETLGVTAEPASPATTAVADTAKAADTEKPVAAAPKSNIADIDDDPAPVAEETNKGGKKNNKKNNKAAAKAEVETKSVTSNKDAIVVLGATGKAGKTIVSEFVSRGTAVSAVARDPSRIQKDDLVTAQTADVSTVDLVPILQGAKVVICVVGPTPDPTNDFQQPQQEGADAWLGWMRKVIQASKDAKVGRLIMMGGAATILNAEGVSQLNSGDFPEPLVHIGTAHSTMLDEIRKTTDLTWTVITPPNYIQAGERSGVLKFGSDNVEDAKSSVSYEDFAVAVCDEVEKEQYLNQRVCVSN